MIARPNIAFTYDVNESHALSLKELNNDYWEVGILPSTGGSIAYCRIRKNGAWRDLLRPTPIAYQSRSSTCSSFVLVPWSNRLRDARFKFKDQTYQLIANHADGKAIHGVGRDHPWQVRLHQKDVILLTFDTKTCAESVNFPFSFVSTQKYMLAANRFSITVSVTNTDTRTFPVGVGHHPYFVRFFGADHDAVHVRIPCQKMFVLHDQLPNAAPVPVSQNVDFQALRELPETGLDDCFTARVPDAPIQIRYPLSGTAIDIHLDTVFSCVILYTPPEDIRHFALEPVTNANDGFNLYADGIPYSGVVELHPAEVFEGTITFELHV
jgi:aldose 1-epimerase